MFSPFYAFASMFFVEETNANSDSLVKNGTKKRKPLKKVSFVLADFEEAYKCQEIVVSSFAKILGSCKDENWPLPVMQVINNTVRVYGVLNFFRF
jgi:hypothetical protein